jgi:hypothetical protein
MALLTLRISAVVIVALLVLPASAKVQSQDALDQLVAPVALYPDQLLAQMLLCAANPGKIGTLNEWLASHGSLKGTELQDAAAKAGFGASYVALVLFPDVVGMMAEKMDWTAKLGKAFTDNKSAVFDSIQRLRTKAKTAGTLKSTPQQDVETKSTSSGQQVIVIEPANPQVVYVPQYNPTVVYTESSSSSDAVAAGIIGFTAGIAIGAAIDNDYYYGPYGWRGGAYMYNDAWDDYYDHREDARDDWMDHREDLYEERGEQRENLAEERGERSQNAQEQRTERTQSRQENSPESQAQREQRRSEAQTKAQNRSTTTSTATGTSQEARGYSRDAGAKASERSGTRSDAFSGYSSGKSERAASSRGKSSRSSSRGGRR